MAGQEFLDSARHILEEAEAITVRLKTRSRGESGRLTIGVHASLSTGNLRATLMEYRDRFPHGEIHIVDGSSDHLLSDVAFIAEENPQWGDKIQRQS